MCAGTGRILGGTLRMPNFRDAQLPTLHPETALQLKAVVQLARRLAATSVDLAKGEEEDRFRFSVSQRRSASGDGRSRGNEYPSQLRSNDGNHAVRNFTTLPRLRRRGVRRRMSCRLNFPTRRRGRSSSQSALHRPRSVYLLRRLRARLPLGGDLRGVRSPRSVSGRHRVERAHASAAQGIQRASFSTPRASVS